MIFPLSSAKKTESYKKDCFVYPIGVSARGKDRPPVCRDNLRRCICTCHHITVRRYTNCCRLRQI